MSQGAAQDADRRVGYAVKRLQQTLRTAADRALRPCGLTLPQYAVLSALAAQPGLSSSELARRCFVTRQTMNGLLTGLQTTALVARTAHPRDGRILRTALTPTGKSAARRADILLAGVEDQMTAGLNNTRLRQLLAMLQACTLNLDPTDDIDPGSGPTA